MISGSADEQMWLLTKHMILQPTSSFLLLCKKEDLKCQNRGLVLNFGCTIMSFDRPIHMRLQ